MTDPLGVLGFSLSVTAPIFLVLALGWWLRRIGMLDDGFVATASRLVFTVALPALLFISIAGTRLAQAANLRLILFGVAATLLSYLALQWLAQRVVSPAADRAVVVIGGFRSNMAIVGLAYYINAYGPQGLASASIYVGVVSIVFNILSVTALSTSSGTRPSRRRMLREIAGNPIIIGIVAALPVSWLALQPPGWMLRSGEYFAHLALPLALLCTGASLDFARLRGELGSTVLASFAKLIGVPLLFVLGGLAAGFRGPDLGLLLLMSSAPSAAASYVMVRAMGGNATLAANVIAITTLGSVLSTSLGLIVLRSLGWI